VAWLGALRDLLTVRIYDELAGRLTAAALGRSGDAAVFALAEAYQADAEEHPHRYALMPQTAPAPGVTATRGPDPVATAGARVVSVFYAVLAGFPQSGDTRASDTRLAEDDLVHAVRGLRAALHGFAVLSLSGGFGLPADEAESRRRLIATFVAGLRVIHRPRASVGPGF